MVAQRLQSAARPSEVLVADSTYRLAAGAAIVEPVDPVPAKGISEPVPAWSLIGVQAGAEAVPRRLDTPLVGRLEELDRLRAAFDAAVAERRCRLVMVLGPAGIGKSRLVGEFVRDTEPQATVRIGRCLALRRRDHVLADRRRAVPTRTACEGGPTDEILPSRAEAAAARAFWACGASRRSRARGRSSSSTTSTGASRPS